MIYNEKTDKKSYSKKGSFLFFFFSVKVAIDKYLRANKFMLSTNNIFNSQDKLFSVDFCFRKCKQMVQLLFAITVKTDGTTIKERFFIRKSRGNEKLSSFETWILHFATIGEECFDCLFLSPKKFKFSF